MAARRSAPMLVSALIAAFALPAAAGPRPVPLTDSDFTPYPAEEVALGRDLFWDPVLSGNRNISCGTCHHPRFGTGDGLSLGMGDGGVGLGPDRVADALNRPEQRIPRNAPALFDLGITGLRTLFYDGRIEADAGRPTGFRTPLEDEMVTGFASLLSAQAMFPVLAQDEMAGHARENEIATAVRQGRLTGEDGAWDRIAARVRAIPAYEASFRHVYPAIAAGRPLDFTDISNAIAAFVAVEWRSDSAPFDAWLRDETALPPLAAEGADIFYGRGGCGDCHAGAPLTDQAFHAMGTPQIGPGKGERFEPGQRDLGRMRVTGHPADAYAFRTPSLRNVAETGPWGHDGAFSDLRAFVAFHADPVGGHAAYRPQATLPAFDAAKDDWAPLADPEETAAILARVTQAPVQLSGHDLDALMAFLDTLTDPRALEGRLGIPDSVPSGLPIDR